MNSANLRISALIITYNQENLIERAVHSLIKQRGFLYEICVSDDCSLDNTWAVLKRLKSENEGLLKIQRNDTNVGIFSNIERAWRMASGNMIFLMSGDDECCDGWFEEIYKKTTSLSIDPNNQAFTIYGDYMIKYNNNDTRRVIQRFSSRESVFRLALRGYLCNRAACYSRTVLNSFHQLSVGKSHQVEMAQDRQLQLFSRFNYYIPVLANVYYAGIGVSRIRSDEMKQDRLKIASFMKSFIFSLGYNIKKKDLYYLDYYEAKLRYNYYPTFHNFTRTFLPFILSFDLLISIRKIRNTVRSWVFSFLMRSPHRSPISV